MIYAFGLYSEHLDVSQTLISIWLIIRGIRIALNSLNAR